MVADISKHLKDIPEINAPAIEPDNSKQSFIDKYLKEGYTPSDINLPSNKKHIEMNDFTGGLNVDIPEIQLANNELSRANNIVLLKRGGWKKRPGTSKFNATSYSRDITQLFEWKRKDGTVQLMAVSANSVIANPNLLDENMANGGEDGTTTGYAAQNTANISASTEEAAQGIYSQKVVTWNTGSAEGIRTNSKAVTANTTIIASVYLKGSGTVYLALNERDLADTTIGVATPGDLITLTDEWTRYNVSKSFGATGVKARIIIYTDIQQAATFYADKFKIEEDELTDFVLPSDVPYQLHEVAENGGLTDVQEIQRNYVAYFPFKDELYFIDGTNYYSYDGTTSSAITGTGANMWLLLKDISGEFLQGETITNIQLRATTTVSGFSVGETVTGGSSSASAKVLGQSGIYLFIHTVTGTFTTGETVTGATSGATLTLLGSSFFSSTTGTFICKITLGDSVYIGINQTSFDIRNATMYVRGSTTSASISFSEYENSLPVDFTAIKRCKYAVRHSNSFRFFFAGDSSDQSAIYYSEYNQPDYVKPTATIYPSEAEGPITGLKVMMGYLVVLFKNGIWVYTGADPAVDAEWQKIPAKYGTVADMTVELATHSMITLTSGGLYKIYPSILGMTDNMVPGEQFMQSISAKKVDTYLNAITDQDEAVATYDSKNKRYLLGFCDDSSGENNKILCYDEVLNAFTLWTGISPYDILYREDGTVLIATENFILKLDDSVYLDINIPTINTKNIEVSVKSPFPLVSSLFNRKRIAKVYLCFKHYQLLGFPTTLTLNLYADNSSVKAYSISGALDNELKYIREEVSFIGDRFYLLIGKTDAAALEVYGVGFDYEEIETYRNT
jgi:hypothetical protein